MAAITLANFIVNAVRTIVTATINIIKSLTVNRRMLTYGFGLSLSVTMCFILVFVIGRAFIDASGYGLSKIDKLKKKQDKSKNPLMKLDKNALLLLIGTLAAGLQQYIFSTARSVLESLFSSLIFDLCVLLVCGLGYLAVQYLNVAMPGTIYFYQQIFVPIMNLVIILGTTAAIVYESIMPILNGIHKFITSIPYRLLNVAIVCLWEIFTGAVQLAAGFIYALTAAIVQWIVANPLKSELPLGNAVNYLGRLLALVTVTSVDCGCYVLRYVIGGIVRAFAEPSFGDLAQSAFNFGWVTLSQVIINPVFSLFTLAGGGEFVRPSFVRSNELYISTLDFAGIWLQNVTTYQFDIYWAGGNGTLIEMVNGTLPAPTNDWQYLVRFLQSSWAQFLIRGASFVLVQPIWQFTVAINEAPNIFQANGSSTAWNFNITYNEGIFLSSALGSILNIPGNCTVTTTSYPVTPFAQLATVVAVAIGLVRVAWDCAFGELYYSFANLTFPGIFTQQYLQTSPIKATLWNNVQWLGVAWGCLLAYIDAHFGTTFQGAVETILFWLWVIPVEFIVNIRAIFGGTSALVLDSNIEVSAMELSMLKIATFGGFFYQFEPGANDTTCPPKTTLLCNLGLAIQDVVKVVVRLVVVALDILIQFVKFITGSIQNNSIQSIIMPSDIACDPTLQSTSPQLPGASCVMRLTEDIYDAGCRLGVVIGNVIPIDIPCMTGVNNFCAVSEFQNIGTSTFTKCTATFGCKVGRWLGILPDFFFTLFNWVVSWNWSTPTGGTTDPDNQFVVSIFKKVMSLVIFGLLAPLCPFAHVVDCLWSLITKSGAGDSSNEPFSSLVCLITAFLVVLIRDVGDVIIILIRIVVFFLSLIFGVSALGDIGALTKLIEDFFTVLGQTIEKILLLILTFALQAIFSVLYSICNIFAGLPGVDCSPLSMNGTLANILSGLGVKPIDSPENRNYKREVQVEGFDASTWTDNCTTLFNTPEYAQMFSFNFAPGDNPNRVCSKQAPGTQTQPPTRPTSPRDQYRPLKEPSAVGSFEVDKRSLFIGLEDNENNPFGLSLMQTVIMRHFGPGPKNPDNIPEYMYKNVYWKPDSSCHLFFERAQHKNISSLGPSDQITIQSCIRFKLIAVTVQTAIPLLTWIPEDILYNPIGAIGGLLLKILHFALVVAQFFVDRNTPAQELLTRSYQARWNMMSCKIGFYNETLLPIFQSTSNITLGAQLVKQAVLNMTLLDYLHRNFPALYYTNSKGEVEFSDDNPLIEPFRGFLDYTYEVAKDAAIGAGITSEKILAFRNSTYGFYFNYTSNMQSNNLKSLPYYKQPENLYYQGQFYDYHNRTHLLRALGEDVVRVIDGYRSTKSLYGIIGRMLDLITDFTANRTSNAWRTSPNDNTTNINWKDWFYYQWDQYSASPNDSSSGKAVNKRYYSDHVYEDGTVDTKGLFQAFGELLSEAKAAPAAVTENGSFIMDHLRKGLRERMESLFQSPAYEHQMTPFGAMVASAMKSIYDVVNNGTVSRVLPPWCVAKAARAHNMTFAEVRRNLTIEDCDYYDRISFKGNYSYDQFRKEYYKPDAQGNMVRAEPTEEEKMTFWERIWQPMNEQAKINRAAIGNIFDSVGKELWTYGYLFFGENGTAADRMIEILMDKHPSFSDFRKMHNTYHHMVNELPAENRERVMRTGHMRLEDMKLVQTAKSMPGVEWLFNMSARFREAAQIRQLFIDEQTIHSFGKYAWIAKNQRQMLNEQLGIRTGQQYYELVNRFSTQVRHHLYASKFYEKAGYSMTPYDRALLADSFLDDLPGGLNFTELFSKHCYTSQLWLCQQCFILDATLGRVLQIVNYAIGFYTSDFPRLVEDQAAIINYYNLFASTNVTNPPVYIGNSHSLQPRLVRLEDKTMLGDMFQFTPDETANGLNFFKPIYQIIGLNISQLIPNGTCYQSVINYNLTSDMSNSPTSNLFTEFLRIIQLDLGIDICGVIDTFEFIFVNCIPAVVQWVVNHIFLCNYTTHLDATARNYSLNGGIIVVGVYLIILVIAITLIFYFNGTLTMLILGAIFIALPFAFLILVYNWCFLCTPLIPTPLIDDIIKSIVYTPTIVGPCSILIGSLINDTSYTNLNCAQTNLTHSYANGADLGFANPLNNLQFALTAYGTDWGLSKYVVPIWGFLFGQNTPTFTYDDYKTDPIRAANYQAYFFISTIFYFLPIVILVAKYTISIGLSLVGNLYGLFQTFIIGFFAILKFTESML